MGVVCNWAHLQLDVYVRVHHAVAHLVNRYCGTPRTCTSVAATRLRMLVATQSKYLQSGVPLHLR
jgi:hypothetical protein